MKNFSFVLLSAILMISSCTTKKPQPEIDPVMKLLVGTYTGERSEGIYQLQFDTKTGDLSDLKLLAATSNPSFLDISSDGELVYSVSEDEEGTISAWKWDEQEGLSLINQVPTFGKHPCYVDVANGVVAYANYSSGNGGVYGVMSDGGLSKGVSEFQHYGSSKNTERQSEPHAHFSQISPDGKLLYVVDLGIDQVIAYPLAQGKLGAAVTALATEPGDGPRHLEFHPSKDLVFIATELNSMVISASVDAATGTFTELDRKSAIPAEFTGDSYCADIHVSPDGKFLYVSNRGHQSIAIFKIGEDGGLESVGTEPVRGDWPRNFIISPDGKFLLVANQNSSNITVFERDSKSGLLTFTGKEVKLSHPVCLKLAKLAK